MCKLPLHVQLLMHNHWHNTLLQNAITMIMYHAYQFSAEERLTWLNAAFLAQGHPKAPLDQSPLYPRRLS